MTTLAVSGQSKPTSSSP